MADKEVSEHLREAELRHGASSCCCCVSIVRQLAQKLVECYLSQQSLSPAKANISLLSCF